MVLDSALERLLDGSTSHAQSLYVSLIKKCAEARSLAEGRRIHAHILRNGCIAQTILANLLIYMYGRSSSISEAVGVFTSLSPRNVFSWISLLTAFSQCRHLQQVQKLFQIMPMHNSAAWNTMITAFSQNSCINQAKQLFDSMPWRETVSWNSMIVGFAKNGLQEQALGLFQMMILEGEAPNRITFLGVLDACGSPSKIDQARMIHSEISTSGNEFDVFVGTAIIGMYGRCGSPEEARLMFDRMSEKNSVSWTSMLVAYSQNELVQEAKLIFDSTPVKTLVSWSAMVSAYSQNDQPRQALLLFTLMDLEGFCPNVCTFTSAIDAAANGVFISQGRILHSEVEELGFISELPIAGALVNLYGRCGRSEEAKRVFDKLPEKNEVVVTALICAFNRDFPRALQAFRSLELEGLRPKSITFVSILDSCNVLSEGVALHERIRSSGLEQHTFTATALACMYRRCNQLNEVKFLFHQLPVKSVITWTVMFVAFVESGCEREALELFRRMDVEGVQPDKIVLTTVLDACANLSDATQGKIIHRSIEESGKFSLEEIATGLIDMYGKCGNVEQAKRVFESLVNEPEMVTWSSMITAYAQNGHGDEALELFKVMELQGVEANEIGLVSVLSACARSGMSKEGLEYFFSIQQDRRLRVLPEHIVCLVDLLGKAGEIELANQLIEQSLSSEIDKLVAWTALLGACKIHGDDERAESIAGKLMQLDSKQSSSYILLSNLHTEANYEQKLSRKIELRASEQLGSYKEVH